MSWVKIHDRRFERPDGAVVNYDLAASTCTSKPWLAGHRGFRIYLPTEEYPEYFRTKRGVHVPLKYKTAESAMKALDKMCPYVEARKEVTSKTINT